MCKIVWLGFNTNDLVIPTPAEFWEAHVHGIICGSPYPSPPPSELFASNQPTRARPYPLLCNLLHEEQGEQTQNLIMLTQYHP